MQKTDPQAEPACDFRVLPASGLTHYIVRGAKEILSLRSLLHTFSERCGQSEAVQDLEYFLGKPGLLRRTPCLVLLAVRRVSSPQALSPEDLAGTLLLLEYSILQLRTRAFATNDRAGRTTLICPPHQQFMVVAAVCMLLMNEGARVVALSFKRSDGTLREETNPHLRKLFTDSRINFEWSTRDREFASYLPLKKTYEETLASLGQKTRSNLRYYRRRAEAELGCHPVHAPVFNEHEILLFNQDCMYPVSESTLRWRLAAMKSMDEPFFLGMKDGAGQWLSLVAGRRSGGTSEILWQLNHKGYRGHSLGTVMRSYCMEQEIRCGAKRLQVEGGTGHSMAHSFVQEIITDFVVVRSRYKRVVTRWLEHFLLADNMLSQMFKSNDVIWCRAHDNSAT